MVQTETRGGAPAGSIGWHPVSGVVERRPYGGACRHVVPMTALRGRFDSTAVAAEDAATDGARVVPLGWRRARRDDHHLRPKLLPGSSSAFRPGPAKRRQWRTLSLSLSRICASTSRRAPAEADKQVVGLKRLTTLRARRHFASRSNRSRHRRRPQTRPARFR